MLFIAVLLTIRPLSCSQVISNMDWRKNVITVFGELMNRPRLGHLILSDPGSPMIPIRGCGESENARQVPR